MRAVIQLCLVLMMLLLSACDPFSQPDSMMKTYTERLARVLELENQTSQLIEVQTLPRMRDRRIEIEQIKINMLDFLSLYGCQLQVVVGERNSAMGRVMTPLNDLRYQLEFIEKARQCLPKIEQQELKSQLQQAIEQKHDALPHYFWNAIWADEPMAELMSQSGGFYQQDDGHISPATLKADLTHAREILQTLQSGSLAPELKKMGEIQQHWVFDHSGGQLINSIRLLITRLNDASDMLEQKITGKPLCYMNKPNPRAERVKGVFFNVYIARVQPYISHVSRAGEQVFSGLSALIELQKPDMPASFQPYYQRVLDMNNHGSLWYQFDQAVMRHTKSWQKLLRQCGMQPMAG
jgi:hypothetical protein